METFGTTHQQDATIINQNGGRLPNDGDGPPRATAANQDCQDSLHYSANITAACQAASSASSRLYCTSKQEKLERRRLSNRRSALRKRVQEQAEIESLEGQIRWLAQANCQLKTEEARLEQLLRQAQNSIRGKRHFHQNVPTENFFQKSLTTPSNPSSTDFQTMAVAAPVAASFRPQTAFPSTRVRTIAQFIGLQASADGKPLGPIDVNPWDHPSCNQELFVGANDLVSSSSGEDVLAALNKVVDKSEQKMYGLVTPLATAQGSEFFATSVQDANPPENEIDAVWNVLLTRAAQDESFLHFLHSKVSSTVPPAMGRLTTTTPDAQQMSSVTNQEKPCSILSNQDNIVQFGYSSGCSSYPTEFPAVAHKRLHDEQNAQADVALSNLPEYFFQFEHKMESFMSQGQSHHRDCGFSDQSSSCSADLDRFLALDEQLD